LHADLANLLTALRFAHRPKERDQLPGRLELEQPQALFIGPGRLPFDQLAQASSQQSINDALDHLLIPPFAELLQAGFRRYQETNRLSDIERHLRRFRLTRLARLIRLDPLGLGVLIGYLELKMNELHNLAEASGTFIERGSSAPKVSPETSWEFRPKTPIFDRFQ
jgi:vacuolar-type H+-ATPase subunit C/Vma6